jgi:hypothetical protein
MTFRQLKHNMVFALYNFASSLFPTIPGLLSIFFPSLELGQFSRWLTSSLGNLACLMYFAQLMGVNPYSIFNVDYGNVKGRKINESGILTLHTTSFLSIGCAFVSYSVFSCWWGSVINTSV